MMMLTVMLFRQEEFFVNLAKSAGQYSFLRSKIQ